MKTNLLFLATVFVGASLVGQDHHVINFDGVNATPETVLVKNLTQDTEVTLQGNQTLHLIIKGVWVDELTGLSENNLTIYPNPFEHSCNIEFKNFKSGRVAMHLYDIGGRLLHQLSDELSPGLHTFLLKGLPAGSYFLNVQTKTGQLSGKFVVTGQSRGEISLKHIDEVPLKTTFSGNELSKTHSGIISKTEKSVVEMDFWPGDEMLFVGFADDFDNAGIYDTPEGDKTYTFEFTNWWPADYVHCNILPTAVVEVLNPTTGVTWMDRNIGASRAATARNDVQAYGDLFQWGRFADGHQCRNSPITGNLSSSDQPGHGNFIKLNNISPWDWRSPQNTNLWQENGINNPCPSGYRLPTLAELNAERLSWDSNNPAGAFASPLKLPSAGFRPYAGWIWNVGITGSLWSSTVIGIKSGALSFSGFGGSVYQNERANGQSVRCLKDPSASLANLPLVVTASMSYITNSSATSGGTITNYGSSAVTARGVVWSISQNPTLESNLGSTSDGTGSGIFTSNITGLAFGTTYYVRAYATNSVGTAYGNQVTLTTNGGDSYTYPPGYVHCVQPYAVIDATNPVTGKTWMDRNLGASRAATASQDLQAYGDLFQWGRFAAGHQCRNSPTTPTLSNSDQPGHGSFILVSNSPYDWRSPQNDNLWQGVDGINNPCPEDYRLPTEAEWDAERLSWGSNNPAGAFASPLKLPVAGYRNAFNGSLYYVGSSGYYWSSTVSGATSRYLRINPWSSFDFANRATGLSVRCLRISSTSLPTVTTTSASNISNASATSGGNITTDGGAAVTARGVVWGISENPTLESNLGSTSDGSGSGIFSSSITELTSGTPYFVRAFATNSSGTAYGDQVSFTTTGGGTGFYPPGYVHCGEPTVVVDVSNFLTGRIWMDRNLGASRAAIHMYDTLAYGDLFQWGRFADGHQCRNSPNTSTISNSNQPGHGSFILAPNHPYDWRSPQNDNLWQGAVGVNNPCPDGYRLPTQAELEAERLSWASNNADGAYASPLKFPLAGYRRGLGNGMILDEGYWGYLWSSTVSGSASSFLSFNNTDAFIYTFIRAIGFSVRCFKD